MYIACYLEEPPLPPAPPAIVATPTPRGSPKPQASHALASQGSQGPLVSQASQGSQGSLVSQGSLEGEGLPGSAPLPGAEGEAPTPIE